MHASGFLEAGHCRCQAVCCARLFLTGGLGGAPSEAWRDQVEMRTSLRQPKVAVNAVESCSRKTEMCLNLSAAVSGVACHRVSPCCHAVVWHVLHILRALFSL